jgi:RNA polymerase sigma-70 factor (ECF subfamily)
MEGLIQVLSDEIVLYSDGGGKVRTLRHPLHGADLIGHYLFVMQQKVSDVIKIKMQPMLINGQIGMVGYIEERLKESSENTELWYHRAFKKGEVAFAMGLTYADNHIKEIDIIVNPEKLQHIPARNEDENDTNVRGMPKSDIQ